MVRTAQELAAASPYTFYETVCAMIVAIADESLCIGDITTMCIDCHGQAHIAPLTVPPTGKIQCGIAARDIEAGEIVRFSPIANTDDIWIKTNTETWGDDE